MITYYDPNRVHSEARLHPYTAADATQSGFVDFTQHPELIETVLEDFRPHAHTTAVKAFYDFLRWINGPTSHLATCDCVLRSPITHQDSNSHYGLSAHGRLFILFRHLEFNSSLQNSDWLCGMMMAELRNVDDGFPATHGVVGFTKQPALQTAISNGIWHGERRFEPGEKDPGFGYHLMLSFWGYGDTEEEAFKNLERVFRNIWTAAERISASMGQSMSHSG